MWGRSRFTGPTTLQADRKAGARTAGGVPEPRIKDAHLMRRHEHVDMLAHSTRRRITVTALARASRYGGPQPAMGEARRREVQRSMTGIWTLTALKGCAMETWKRRRRRKAGALECFCVMIDDKSFINPLYQGCIKLIQIGPLLGAYQ